MSLMGQSLRKCDVRVESVHLPTADVMGSAAFGSEVP